MSQSNENEVLCLVQISLISNVHVILFNNSWKADKSKDLKVIRNLCYFTVVYIYTVYMEKLKRWLALKNKLLTKKKGRKKKRLMTYVFESFLTSVHVIPSLLSDF